MSRKLCFVFCHGFGFDSSFWDPLRPYFSKMEAVYMDLGYFGEGNAHRAPLFSATCPPREGGDPSLMCYGGNAEDRSPPSRGRQWVDYIGIGHSLGLIKLMSLDIPFKRLIGLHGFIHFLGFNERLKRRRRRELMHLIEHFNAAPELTLEQFYQRTGVDFKIPKTGTLNRIKLLDDLTLLTQPVPVKVDIPMLILGSNDDKIVPPELIEDNFGCQSHVTIEILNQAQHGLGYLKPDLVYQRIMNFVTPHVIPSAVRELPI